MPIRPRPPTTTLDGVICRLLKIFPGSITRDFGVSLIECLRALLDGVCDVRTPLILFCCLPLCSSKLSSSSRLHRFSSSSSISIESLGLLEFAARLFNLCWFRPF